MALFGVRIAPFKTNATRADRLRKKEVHSVK